MKLSLQILTPEKEVFNQEVDEVLVPTVMGELGILPEHVALLTQIQPGEIKIINGSKTDYLAITGGYLEVNNNKVNILGDYAIRSEEIEASKAEEAIKRAENKKKDKVSDEELKALEDEIRRHVLGIKVSELHKNRKRRLAS